jgi:uncharacterized metal-binding protein (TIGR02443 family)
VAGKVVKLTPKDRRIAVCPRCGERDMVNYGKYKDVQKYHCVECGHTTCFPALVGKELLKIIQSKRMVT